MVIAALLSPIGLVSGATSTEWPVYFEHLGLVHSVHNKWDLALSTKLHLPKLEARILKTIHRLRLLRGKYDQEASKHFRSSEEKSRFVELQESWTKLNRQLSRRAENMRRRCKNLKSLGAPAEKNNPKRKKRQTNVNEVDAVIQLTGGILQSMFGVAYTDDVRKVVSRIDKIDDDLSSDINVVKSSQTTLQRKTVDTLSKQDNTIQMVEKMARTVERKVIICFLDTVFSKVYVNKKLSVSKCNAQ